MVVPSRCKSSLHGKCGEQTYRHYFRVSGLLRTGKPLRAGWVPHGSSHKALVKKSIFNRFNIGDFGGAYHGVLQ
jgi:hypothetical protein